jgi:ribosomal protein S18 acetylase RimI-like enzyme
LNNYKIINVGNKKVGCLLVENKDDGVLLDEIYIDEEYRNRKIGSDIIKKILLNNSIVYLWVYKLNKKAISLYKNLGFIVIEETDTRYHMKYEFNK